eukprot:scaffold20842_cov33-Tisochrysis_lutea.AAC.5
MSFLTGDVACASVVAEVRPWQPPRALGSALARSGSTCAATSTTLGDLSYALTLCPNLAWRGMFA